jgi:hypothetical protein
VAEARDRVARRSLYPHRAATRAALGEEAFAAAWGHTPSGARWVCRALSIEEPVAVALEEPDAES